MFPEAEVVVSTFGPAGYVPFTGLFRPLGRPSVGVGGVVVSTGASLKELARDFGESVMMLERL